MGPAYLVFLISLIPAIIVSSRVRYNLNKRDADRLDQIVSETADHIDRHLNQVTTLLQSVRGLFLATQKIRAREWNLFLDSLGFSETATGLRDIGFALRISAADREWHLLELGRDVRADYNIGPKGDRPEYFPIIFLRDADFGDVQALGWDPYSDEQRHLAMDRARDLALPVATDRITMLLPNGRSPMEGRIVYLPVYRGALQPASIEERRQKLAGFVFASFREEQFWKTTLVNEASPQVDLEIFDQNGRISADSYPQLNPYREGEPGSLVRERSLNYFGHSWTFRARTLRPFYEQSQHYVLWLVIASAGVISLTLFTIARTQAKGRASAEQMMAELKKSERALSESEARFRRLADNARDVIYRLRLKPTIGYEYISPAIERLSGHAPSRFYENPGFLRDFVHPDDRHYLDLSGSMDKWFGGPVIVRWLTRGGATIWTETRNVPVHDEAGNLIAMEGIARDITESKFIEDTIRRNEERLSRILQTIADGVLILDGEGKITFSNAAAEQILGLPNDGPEVAELVELLQKNTAHSFGYSFERANSTVFLSVNSASFSGSSSRRGIVASIRDVSAEKRNEQSLLQSQTRLRVLNGILAHMAAGVEVNQILVRTVAQLARDFPHLQILFSLPTEHRKWMVVSSEGGAASIKGCAFDFQTMPEFESELRQKRPLVVPDLACDSRYTPLPDNSYFDGVRAALEQPIRDGDKFAGLLSFHCPRPHEWTAIEKETLAEIAFYIAAAHAQTEVAQSRREAEAALKAEKERLSVTLRSIADGVITTDIEGKVALLNRAAEALTGWTQLEAIGRPIADVFTTLDEKSREKLPNPAVRVLAGGAGAHVGVEVILVARDQSERVIAKSAAPMRDQDGKIVGAVLVCRDITEKRRYETELVKASKLESVGLLAGGIAHDFNNILSIVLGNVTLCKVLAPPVGSLHERLDQAEKGCLRARDLTQQLLTFAKGGSPIRKAASIAEIVHESTAFAARGSNIVCKNTAAPDLWPVEVDEGQISQVFNNLVINAVQAMPEGGIIQTRMENWEITADHSLPIAPGRYVHITVQDNGIGISRDHLARIFDPYFSTKKGGSGLGLATTYAIIQKHQGCITAESIEHVGTTFHIYLPASTAPLPAKQTPAQPVPRGGGRILVMDDETSILDLARASLRHFGYEVETAEHGIEAIEKFEDARASGQPFAAVIMDLTVPGGMGGKEAMKRLLEIDPHVRAIVSSGYSHDPVMADYRQYGFSGVVEKPYQIETLAKALTTVLNGH